jgi:lysophospholipase L1-like esterase
VVGVRRLSLVLALLASFVLTGPAAQAAAPAPPAVMAATGDSITRAFDATLFGCFLSDCPQYSWSTGTSSSVTSQFARLRALNPALTANNDAKTGAKMAALGGQLTTAAGQQADYVTVLMGANDVCTSSIATMTATATFTDQFRTALAAFVAARPTAQVFVSSIPNVYQLWSLLHTKASGTWRTFGICQSMLSSSNTEAQRQTVLARERTFNDALSTVCAEFAANCRFDAYATFTYVFTTSDVSTVDYFHPSITGQRTLAGLTWAASYWG